MSFNVAKKFIHKIVEEPTSTSDHEIFKQVTDNVLGQDEDNIDSLDASNDEPSDISPSQINMFVESVYALTGDSD
jgi:hypothetical protein